MINGVAVAGEIRTPPLPVAAAVRVAAAVPVAARAGPAPVAAAVPNIDACVSRLDPQLDIGYDRIAARCPELMRQLDGGTWAPWLPRGWKEAGNDLSAGGLREFRELVDRESGAGDVTGAVAPDVRNLQPILTALAGSRNENGWSRFKSWLRSILERREQPTDESWFSRMVSHVGVSQSVIRLITYGSLAAVVLLAGVIVVNEARTAGIFPKRRRAARTRRELAAAGTAAASWGDIEKTPLRDRPRLLLELIVRRLSDRGLLPPAGALTVRELTRAVRLTEADDRSRLADLALAAEQVRYAAAETAVGGLDEPLARGRELLDRLDGSAVARLNAGATG
ncbi:MAG TPA: hypothetical protein VNO35_22625 [Steroidobacteraceae bacterium]|nr:hypothetical protein [Steroidobacteraceae bacterium]